MKGSKVEARGSALPHLVPLHLSFLRIEKLLNVTCRAARIQCCHHAIFSIELKLSAVRDITTLIRSWGNRRTAYLQVVYSDRVGDAVGTQVLGHMAQTGAGHSDVDGELSGDRIQPEVQLGSESMNTHEVLYWKYGPFFNYFSVLCPQIDQAWTRRTSVPIRSINEIVNVDLWTTSLHILFYIFALPKSLFSQLYSSVELYVFFPMQVKFHVCAY